MSHTNYNKMYSKPEVEEEVPGVIEEPVKEVYPDPTIREVVPATVVGCARLNVREHPNLESKVLTILSASAEVKCVPNHSIGSDFYKIILESGIEGYCVKDYLKLK